VRKRKKKQPKYIDLGQWSMPGLLRARRSGATKNLFKIMENETIAAGPLYIALIQGGEKVVLEERWSVMTETRDPFSDLLCHGITRLKLLKSP